MSLQDPIVQWLLPVPALAGLLWLCRRVFGATWAELDAEAHARNAALAARGEVDRRPLAVAAIGLLVLAWLETFGKDPFYRAWILPRLETLPLFGRGGALDLGTWGLLVPQLWWGLTRVAGYLAPLAVWRLLFPGDRVRDLGLRFAGFRAHAWIYGLAVAVVIPAALLASRQPDFGAYYPMYRPAGRSWLDLALWEAIYVSQFLALEVFFRGFWLRASRSLGAAAIFFMAVPYAMIHFHKPWLEIPGALVAGVVLGSLSARTGSIWAGFLVHSTIALLMDLVVLSRRGELPLRLAPGSADTFRFPAWGALLAAVWGGAVLLVVLEARRRWRARRRG